LASIRPPNQVSSQACCGCFVMISSHVIFLFSHHQFHTALHSLAPLPSCQTCLGKDPYLIKPSYWLKLQWP
jgi:hypothetical protein